MWHSGQASGTGTSWPQWWQASRRDAEFKTLLGEVLPKRFAQRLCEHWIANKPLRRYNAPELRAIAELLSSWPLVASGTEG